MYYSFSSVAIFGNASIQAEAITAAYAIDAAGSISNNASAGLIALRGLQTTTLEGNISIVVPNAAMEIMAMPSNSADTLHHQWRCI